MPLEARRVFRLSLTVGLALAASYALGEDLPFLAPIFALLFTLPPDKPRGPKALLGLILVVTLTMGAGLILIPLLINYPFSAVLIVVAGVYFASYLTVNLGKGPVAMLLTMGITLISAAGSLSWSLAVSVIDAMTFGIVIAIVSQWLVYPLFPEDGIRAGPIEPPVQVARSNWIARRATLVVMPVYLLTLTDPAMYLPIIMKSVSLGQQSSTVDARNAGWELLGSTFFGGCFAILFWFALGISTNLWMFFLWTVLFVMFFASRLYRLRVSRYAAPFWQNVAVTMLILLGSAVQDSATGKDVYQAFAVRMGLFVAVTIYAWLAVVVLDQLQHRSSRWRVAAATAPRGV